ncbi:MAG: amidohydrolase [Candidatus Marinimicrobia bacterium]|nr:amidohydrolase [Candidatus Neomarinimicrobiota bacterium]MCF7880806.1 amidohydrolase [Candidatus Neomarinimicrobiota bacterium]
MNILKRILSATIFVGSLFLISCGQQGPQFYSMGDFESVDKADVHVHINGADPMMVEQAQADNFKLLTVNVDYPDFPPIDEQQEIAVEQHNEYSATVGFFSTFPMDGWDNPGWAEKTIERIKAGQELGAIGVKTWKNIGMSYRDENGELVMIDDPGFDPPFGYLSEKDIWMIGHQAEPKNCWLPVDSMTVNNDREYFEAHPEYHMYKHPEMPSYEEHMEARNHMLEKNPNLKFMGAHLASLEWSVDRITQFLDRFPNATVDMAARMGQVQYQSIRDYEKVRDFFINYQDRVLYATDLTQAPGAATEEFKSQAHHRWTIDWKYLATSDTLEVPELDNAFKGLRLPADVVDKIYYQNAIKYFSGAWKSGSN